MNPLRILIVDDEPLIRRGIREGLAHLEGVEIAGECENGAEAIGKILSDKPDVVLLDVQMPGCNGLEVVQHVGPERMPAVIFVTAYDEYAVRAFELNAVDYLLKPFDAERLKHALDRARRRLAERNGDLLAEKLRSLLNGKGKAFTERIVVRNGDRYDFVAMETVDWIESANNYVQLHCGTKSHLLGETMTALEQRLDPERFARIHRRTIVNVSRILAAHALINGVYELELRGGAKLTSGRQFRANVQALLQRK